VDVPDDAAPRRILSHSIRRIPTRSRRCNAEARSDQDYTDACRDAGLNEVGIYYSPLSWRYPGYFDVTGTHCADNKFASRTDPSHGGKRAADEGGELRNVKQLLTRYGKIDHIFWDGGWLAHHGSDADAAYFQRSRGDIWIRQMSWPIDASFLDIDPTTGKAHGIMGMVRRYQPTRSRISVRLDGRYSRGRRSARDDWDRFARRDRRQKSLPFQIGGWGYVRAANDAGKVMTRDEMVRYLANCLVRNMTLMLNVAPDGHGVIPDLQQQRLREFGSGSRGCPRASTAHAADLGSRSIINMDSASKIASFYAHILKDYAGTEFRFPPLGALRPTRVYDVWTGRELPFVIGEDGGIQIREINRDESPADTVIAVRYDDDVVNVWR
jgi:alpha-L-fucosidase